jgi:hypothetical protein
MPAAHVEVLTTPELPARVRSHAHLSAPRPAARFQRQVNLKEDRIMRGIVKLLIALAFGAALSGCIVTPVGPPRRAYVGVGVVAPAPVVVVRGGYFVR